MKSAAMLFAVILLAPLVLAVTAFFSGLGQPSDGRAAYREEELGI